MSMCKKKQFLLRFLFVFLLFLFYVVNSSTASGGIVYIVPLKGTIDPGQVNFLERVLLEAENEAAKAVILEIDTPGGMVDSAEKINRLLRDYSGKVYGFVRGNALSAGAYIALSTDAFFMAPNSVIGAAEPVLLGSSEAIDEKNLSAWVGKMRSAAQEQGKDPQLAEAMVRREIEIDGIVKKGELLTLTTQEAEALGFSDGTVDSRSDLLALLDFADAHIVEQNLLWSEKLAS
ncbi:MAG: nodulation protein NfeD, partial [Firmicutes bacterium]|nr:nodulation protein NfeD [Bacillota bacterium]